MYKESAWLLDFAYNVYSETGEDGIIEKIIEILPQTNKWCVEFGAWDGIRASNTRYLIENKFYSAVLIEADKQRFEQLRRNYLNHPRVIVLNKTVGWDCNNNLDQILKEVPEIPLDFDFLSIDVDGNDYHIWKAIVKYKPKVICIEFNPTIPNEVIFIQPPNPNINQGASLSALVELGKVKGYELVAVLDYNAFFVLREFYPSSI